MLRIDVPRSEGDCFSTRIRRVGTAHGLSLISVFFKGFGVSYFFCNALIASGVIVVNGNFSVANPIKRTIMRSIHLSLLAITLFSFSAFNASAQEIPIPDGAAFAVRVNLEQARRTSLGKKLIRAAQEIAKEEIGDDGDGEKVFQEVEKALGFDPIEELRSLTVFGSDFEDPIEGLQIVVGLKKTTGNLEGLLLAIPGYEQSKHKRYTIHSAAPDDDIRVYGAIHEDDRNNKHIVAAHKRSDLTSMLDALRDHRSDSSPSDARSSSRHRNTLIDVQLERLPEIDDLEGPPAAVAKLLKRTSVSVFEQDDELIVELSITTDDEKQAEQIQQLCQGLAAMVGLAESIEEGSEELELAAELLDGLEVDRNGSQVQLQLEVPEELIIKILREEADLPL